STLTPITTSTPTPTPIAITPIPTVETGGTISIGMPSLLNGQILVPVNTTATTDPYAGFNIHLRFDGTLLTASQVGFVSGGALETSGGPTACISALADNGDGIIGGCSISGVLDTT